MTKTMMLSKMFYASIFSANILTDRIFYECMHAKLTFLNVMLSRVMNS